MTFVICTRYTQNEWLAGSFSAEKIQPNCRITRGAHFDKSFDCSALALGEAHRINNYRGSDLNKNRARIKFIMPCPSIDGDVISIVRLNFMGIFSYKLDYDLRNICDKNINSSI